MASFLLFSGPTNLYKHQTGNHQTVIILTFNFLTYQNHLQYTKFPKFDSEKLLKQRLRCMRLSPVVGMVSSLLSTSREWPYPTTKNKFATERLQSQENWQIASENWCLEDDPLLFGVSAYFLVRRVSFRECSDSWTFTLSIIYNKITTRWTQKLSYQ